MTTSLHYVLAFSPPRVEHRTGPEARAVNITHTLVEMNGEGRLVQHTFTVPSPPPHLPSPIQATGMFFALLFCAIALIALRSRLPKTLIVLILGAAGLMFGLLRVWSTTPSAPHGQFAYSHLGGPLHTETVPLPREGESAFVAIRQHPAKDPAVVAAAEVTDAPSEDSSSSIAGEGDPSTTVYRMVDSAGTEGRPLESPPEWIRNVEEAAVAPGAVGTFTSARFATIQDAEQDLWAKIERQASARLTAVVPEAAGWTPPQDLLQRSVFVIERCVEQTALKVGDFVEPMYRMHWRLAVPEGLDTQLVRAWEPSMAHDRMLSLAGGFGGLTGLFLLMNLTLRNWNSPRSQKGRKREQFSP